jgi:hypothetical protein
LKKLRENKIRFFTTFQEFNLYDPQVLVYLGICATLHEYQSALSTKKSILSKISRAKQGHYCCGTLPHGRTWNKETKTWGVNKDVKKRVEHWAKLYLEEGYSFKRLAEYAGKSICKVYDILVRYPGSEWVINFKSDRFNIHETVTIPIPELLSKETIERIKRKAGERLKWDHRTPKHEYLLGRLIFDKPSGKALTGGGGQGAREGERWYRKYLRCGSSIYAIKAGLIEDAVIDAVFEMFRDEDILYDAIYKEEFISKKKITELQDQLVDFKSKLDSVDRKISNSVKAVADFDGNGFDSFIDNLKLRIKPLEDERKAILAQISSTENRLSCIPTKKEILSQVSQIQEQLFNRQTQSYYSSGHTFRDLPFEEKRKILSMLFGGVDEQGKKYGVYINYLESAKRKPKFNFEVYGRVGKICGSLNEGNDNKLHIVSYPCAEARQ